MSEFIISYTEQLGREVYLRSGTSDEGTWREAFVEGYHVPPPEMPTPRTVLDLGANIGLTAAHYAAMWPEARILAVEMDRDNAELARRNFGGTVFQRAVTLSTPHVHYSTNVSADAYTISEHGNRAANAVSPISLVVDFFGETPVDFCKVDIEGSEWDIFRGGGWWPDRVKHLLVEFHDEPRDYERILARGIDTLKALGYEARHHPSHPAAVWAVAR